MDAKIFVENPINFEIFTIVSSGENPFDKKEVSMSFIRHYCLVGNMPTCLLPDEETFRHETIVVIILKFFNVFHKAVLYYYSTPV